MKNLNAIVFSPTGSSLKITELLLNEFREEHQIFDITSHGDFNQTMEFNDPTIFSFPVFIGRVPTVVVEKIKKYKGNNTPAVILATIGNRHYDDALLEMRDLLLQQGFIPVTAAVFIAQHSIFNSVANSRPDQEDIQYIESFSGIIKDKLNAKEYKAIDVKGKFPYKSESGILFKPFTNENCTLCGECSISCPAEAIPLKEPDKTDYDKCISCMRCIKICPVNARYLEEKKHQNTEKVFHEKFHKRKNPVFFH